MEETIKLAFGEDGYALIQMINGENRFRTSVIKEWNQALDKVLENANIKGLLITGSGRYFSNGIDVTWLAQQTRDDVKDYMARLATLFKRVMVFPIPTVALMNGHAFGGGAFLALACDFRLMKPDRGWLCWPETAMGMQIPDPLMEIIRAKISQGRPQREAVVYAKRLTGNVAKNLGLVDDVIEESKMADVGKALVKSSLGPKGLKRNIVQQMKKDMYSKDVDFSKL